MYIEAVHKLCRLKIGDIQSFQQTFVGKYDCAHAALERRRIFARNEDQILQYIRVYVS